MLLSTPDSIYGVACAAIYPWYSMYGVACAAIYPWYSTYGVACAAIYPCVACAACYLSLIPLYAWCCVYLPGIVGFFFYANDSTKTFYTFYRVVFFFSVSSSFSCSEKDVAKTELWGRYENKSAPLVKRSICISDFTQINFFYLKRLLKKLADD